ncbi:Cell wall protein [Wickerhamomyces ciferrii]|uniref:Cell wall protein n=1 Tax=Wickerhamomyces ciferrii (strain ATCC 14091 / BCRC 22168 / CBS 111 / JCM 3599 / NBRC 0793 / NRRL Y-1031 F-60-10) TaxID=1206466 RepID=K0KLC6_WICCF|nr:Cell wall protein [Wickerhamomyces ciferrii]CCH42184.1 Cell wall protein [Wickerhamomyces ciferrii]
MLVLSIIQVLVIYLSTITAVVEASPILAERFDANGNHTRPRPRPRPPHHNSTAGFEKRFDSYGNHTRPRPPYHNSTTELDKRANNKSPFTEGFALSAIRSGSPLQYQLVTVSRAQLFLSGNASDPYRFLGFLEQDGALVVIPDPTRYYPESTDDSSKLFLNRDIATGKLLTTSTRETSFSVKDGHLLYKGEDSFSVVPEDKRGYSYSLRVGSNQTDGIGIALRTVTQSGGSIGNYP